MTQDIQSTIQQYLYPREKLVWTGAPNPDGFALYKVGCGELIACVMISWVLASIINGILDSSILSSSLVFLFLTWGIIVWSRWYYYYEGKNTTYAITNQRILILHKLLLIESYTADHIEMVQINKLSSEFNIVYFAKIIKDDGKGGTTTHKIGLVAIPDVEQVVHHIEVLWNRKGSISTEGKE